MAMNSARVQPYIRQVTAWELNETDARWLDKAIKEDYYGVDIKDVIQKAVDGIYTFWRMGNNQGLITTEVVEYGNKLILCGLYLAGQGYIEQLPEIERLLSEYGKTKGCSSIQFLAFRKGLQRVYDKRYTGVAKVYKMEIDYGE